MANYIVIYIKITFRPFLIKSLDHEGWVVGAVVRANLQYSANRLVGALAKILNTDYAM